MPIDTDDVHVTGTLLALVQLIQAAQTKFLNEEQLAHHAGEGASESYWERCRKLYFKTHARHVTAAGLALNDQTFGVVLRLDIPAEMKRTDFEQLPKRFIFNPCLNQGLGGFKSLTETS